MATTDQEAGQGPAERAALEARVRELRDELRRRERQIAGLEALVHRQRVLLGNIQGSLAWRTVMRLRGWRDKVGTHAARALGDGRATALVDRLLRRQLPESPSEADGIARYERWVARNTPTSAELDDMRCRARQLPRQPLFSVAIVRGAAGDEELARCAASVHGQAWERWEVLPGPGAGPGVSRALSPGDPRVRGGGPGMPPASFPPARGDFVVFLEGSDVLAPQALYELALALEVAPDADVVYGDEDELGDDGVRRAPFFKPDWSPDLLLSFDYLGRAVAFSRRLLDEIGGLPPANADGWRHDLALRATERARRVEHLASILVHASRSSRPDVATPTPGEREGARRAVEEAARRRGLRARVETGPRTVRVRYEVTGRPLVSIVMPTRDKADVLRRCVESVDARSTWSARELLVVDNGSSDPAALRYLAALEARHRVLRDRRPFNWSALNNAAAREARGEFLLFMNNDMEVVAPGWIEALLEHGQRAEVGAVGAKLLYPDRTIQHAGVVVGLGVAGHPFKHLPDHEAGYAALPHAVRDVSAVTGACMLVRRDIFDRLGGFDERLPVAFNDVDFCLRLRAAGYLVVYTPYAELLHHESISRGPGHPAADEALVSDRWLDVLAEDPYYSPHLTREAEDYAIAELGDSSRRRSIPAR